MKRMSAVHGSVLHAPMPLRGCSARLSSRAPLHHTGWLVSMCPQVAMLSYSTLGSGAGPDVSVGAAMAQVMALPAECLP